MAATEVQNVAFDIAAAASSAAIPITTPSAGNLLISIISIDKNAGTITGPTGWTLINEDVTTDISMSAYYKVAAGTEGPTIDWSWTSGNASGSEAWFGEYSGLSATPLDQSVEGASDGSSVTSKSTGTTGTTTQTNELAIAYMGADSSQNTNTGRAFTNSFSIISDQSDNLGSSMLCVARRNLVSTGTYETTFSTTDTGDQMSGGLITFFESVASSSSSSSSCRSSSSSSSSCRSSSSSSRSSSSSSSSCSSSSSSSRSSSSSSSSRSSSSSSSSRSSSSSSSSRSSSSSSSSNSSSSCSSSSCSSSSCSSSSCSSSSCSSSSCSSSSSRSSSSSSCRSSSSSSNSSSSSSRSSSSSFSSTPREDRSYFKVIIEDRHRPIRHRRLRAVRS